MKVGFISDVHVGNHRVCGGAVVGSLNDRCRRTLKVLRDAVEVANAVGCRHLVDCGDLFDTHRPIPQMVAAVADVLGGFKDGPVQALLGNHSWVTDAEDDHGMASLGRVAGVEVVDRPTLYDLGEGCELIMVPYRPGPASSWLRGAVSEACARSSRPAGALDARRALVMHLGLHGREERAQSETQGGWAERAPDAIAVEEVADICRDFRISWVVSGNWHGHKVWEFSWPEERLSTVVVQVGALVPTGWDNPGLDGYGKVVVVDFGSARPEVLSLPGPRFVNLSLEEALMGGDADLFVRVQVEGSGDVVGAVASLEERRIAGCIAGFDVQVSRRAAGLAARSAAAAARSAETLADAIVRFIDQMDSGAADKARVRELVGRYLCV